MHLHHLQPVLSFYFAKVIKNHQCYKLNKSVDYTVYLIVTVDDKIQSIKRCELCQLL